MNQLMVLKKLRKTMGYIGIGKLYSYSRSLYKQAYLAKDYATVVCMCLGCQAEKGELQALPLQPTNKGHGPFEIWAIDDVANLPAIAEGY